MSRHVSVAGLPVTEQEAGPPLTTFALTMEKSLPLMATSRIESVPLVDNVKRSVVDPGTR